MEFRLHAFAFVSVAVLVATSHADQALPEVYWYSVLPNTPMPKFIQDLLPALEIGNLGEVSPQLGDIKGQLSSLLLYNAASNMNGLRDNANSQLSSSKILHHPDGSAFNLIGGDQLGDKEGEILSLLFYHPNTTTTSEKHVGEKYHVTIFLLEKDLNPGVKMNFPFDDHHHVHGVGGAKVLTRQAAQSIPFSSSKFSEILDLFSIKPESKEAFIMKKSIEVCEEPANDGEDKYCATSLEGMVDFVASKLGNDVQALTSMKEADDDHDGFLTISAVKKRAGDDNKPIVSCHGLNYAYPVFYCHGFPGGTRVYEVQLAGDDGVVKAKATVVCHRNTTTWDHNHLSFQLLRASSVVEANGRGKLADVAV